MNPEPSAAVKFLILANVIPIMIGPVVFTVAFYRLWIQIRHWAFAALAFACSLGVLAQVFHFLAINIPRYGKTPEQAALAHDIQWLLSTSRSAQIVLLWVLFIGAIGLLDAIKSMKPIKSES